MKAIRLKAFGPPDALQLEQIEMPRPGEGEVLVEVKACGVCYLDVIVRSGMRSRAKLPLTLGHEIAGVVAEVGAGVEGLAKGDRVASTYRIACGHCRYCRGGHGEICDHRQGIGEHRDGGYADYVALPESVLAKVPARCTVRTGLHMRMRDRGGLQRRCQIGKRTTRERRCW